MPDYVYFFLPKADSVRKLQSMGGAIPIHLELKCDYIKVDLGSRYLQLLLSCIRTR